MNIILTIVFICELFIMLESGIEDLMKL